MAVTIVSTAGGATANSFVSESEMTDYCDGRLNATIWTEAEAQTSALVEATRDLTLLNYIGTRVSTTQALAWPRDYAINPDTPSVEFLGNIELLYYGRTIVPQRIKDATCELALQYLLAGTTDLAVADPNQGVIEKQVDVLVTKWASPQARPRGLSRYPRVVSLLTPLLSDAGMGLAMVRA